METMIYTPEHHIPVAIVSYTDAEGVKLSFKKSKTQVYETLSMDKFLEEVYAVARTQGQTTQAR